MPLRHNFSNLITKLKNRNAFGVDFFSPKLRPLSDSVVQRHFSLCSALLTIFWEHKGILAVMPYRVGIVHIPCHSLSYCGD